ncbi:DUF427-domain-containing protein [Sporormia fimetaria CBS 119925]|uniref:DUF427-domain-containing protein n=1 Tax=Sporormia fimetaria CBS 119925 TaxID=1340428 RepID=A0A6A6VFM2_9PLEO|nr:DUF427-domain-containing protein [Sporormia fimetaria CBS 119925]
MTFNDDLTILAQRLVSEGPYKVERTPRRVRGRLNGKLAFDTTDARHVWEHPNYPQFYIPLGCFTSDASFNIGDEIEGTNKQARSALLTVGERTTHENIVFNTPKLDQLVRIEFGSIDQWYEEDLPIYVHPKDPYKRIDILPSSRNIRVELHGKVLAESSSPLLLLETSLRTRFYLPPTCVKWNHLLKSPTKTYCPYKGEARYFHAKATGDTPWVMDAVWCYKYPTAESLAIAGYLCFYNEKVDIYVDGVLEEK